MVSDKPIGRLFDKYEWKRRLSRLPEDLFEFGNLSYTEDQLDWILAELNSSGYVRGGFIEKVCNYFLRCVEFIREQYDGCLTERTIRSYITSEHWEIDLYDAEIYDFHPEEAHIGWIIEAFAEKGLIHR